MLPMNFPGRKAQRQEDAVKRNAERAKRSAKDQLTHLDRIFGEGKGATRERNRLQLAIEASAFRAEDDAQAKAHQEQVRADKQAAKQAAKQAKQ